MEHKTIYNIIDNIIKFIFIIIMTIPLFIPWILLIIFWLIGYDTPYNRILKYYNCNDLVELIIKIFWLILIFLPIIIFIGIGIAIEGGW